MAGYFVGSPDFSLLFAAGEITGIESFLRRLPSST